MKIVHSIKNSNLNLNKKIYECTACKCLFNWNKNSSWFGTWKDWEDGKINIFSCSEQCKNKIKDICE